MGRLLDVQGVRSGYKQMEVLHDVSMHVEEGEIVALLGANGAGKTTLINTISGLIQARAGRILYNGASIERAPTQEIIRLGIAMAPERRQLFGSMSVEENLLLGAYARADKPSRRTLEKDMEKTFELFPRLKERRRQLAESMSGGEQQMAAIARALMAKPKLLLLDEPSLGLAPLIVAQIIDQIVQLREEGATILLAEQNARVALGVSDRAYVVETGAIVISGDAADLLSDESIQQAYLGGKEDATDSMEERIRARARDLGAQASG